MWWNVGILPGFPPFLWASGENVGIPKMPIFYHAQNNPVGLKHVLKMFLQKCPYST